MTHEEMLRRLEESGVTVHHVEDPVVEDYWDRLARALAESGAPIAIKVFLGGVAGRRRLGSVRATSQGLLWQSARDYCIGPADAAAAEAVGTRIRLAGSEDSVIIGGPAGVTVPDEQRVDSPIRWRKAVDRLIEHDAAKDVGLVVPVESAQLYVPWDAAPNTVPSVQTLVRAARQYRQTRKTVTLEWAEPKLKRYVSTRDAPFEAHLIPRGKHSAD